MAQISYGTITITDTTDIERIYPVYCKGGETTAPTLQPLSNWSESVSQAGGDGDYIWQRIVTKKQDIVVTADDYSDAVRLTGDDGASLTITSIQYAQTQNENDTPSYGNSMPSSINEGWWLWVKTIYSDNSEVVIKTKQGQKGDQGYSVTNTRELYYLKTNSTTVPQITNSNQITNTDRQNGWTSVVPSYVTNGSYYTCIETTLNSPTNNLKWSAPVINNALTDTNRKASEAYDATVARDTEINALKATAKYYWWDSEGAHIASGLTSTDSDTNINHSTPNSFGYNALMAPGYLALRYQDKKFMQLSTNSLTFYKPKIENSAFVQGNKAMELSSSGLVFYDGSAANGGNIQAQFGSSGAIQSGDYAINAATDKFSTHGTKIDLVHGEIYSPYFRLSQGTVSDGPVAGIYISGTFEATGALIGYQKTSSSDTNAYWKIGYMTDTNQDKLTYQRADSNGFIELAPSTTFILQKNKIHTGWFGNNGYLTYPQLNSKYYDFGMNLPTSLSDKFLYIRYNSGSNLSTIYQNDSGWTYPFYVDAEGKVHAQNFYIGDSTTPIGGGSGTIAEKLMSGAGSATQPVYFRSDSGHVGEVATTTYQLNAAGAKGVDTSMPTTATDNNVPTTKLMKTFVEGKGYITGYTETDPTVPSWAKASKKPSYGLTEISDTSDLQAIEALTGTNGFLKKTASNTWTLDTSTYLTSYTETDPVFVASAAYGITSSDISNWNSKTSNTGTVTKVTAGTGLKIGTATSGGDITTTGTINHINSVTAKTAAAQSAKTLTWNGTFTIYEEKYDAQGHVTGVASYNMTMPANPNTHNTAYLYAGKSDGTTNAATANGNTHLILTDGDSVTTRRKIIGDGTVSVASDANGNITITGSAHPTSLPNPKSLKLKVYSGTTTSADTTYYGGETNNTEVSVAGATAITGISANAAAGGSTTFTLTKANGTTSTFDVTVTASVATGATKLTDSSGNTISEGSATNPVYFSAGVPVATTYSLNKTVPSNAVFTDTWIAMVGATSSANGTAGYVSAPPKDGYNTKFLRADGTWVVPGGTYSLPLAANGTRGGVQIGYTTSGKNYAVQLSNEKMYVNVPWTDRYVNSAAFADDTSNSTTSPLKMTLTRAGSDTNTVTASLPKVSSSTAGVAPKGASVSTQSQSTKFLREDGTWAAPSYTTNINTATAADNILDGSNSGTEITYAPYTSRQSGLSFYTGTTAPNGTTRLNLNGYLYATKLYSGGTEVLTAHQSLSNYKTKQTAVTAPTATTNKWVNTLAQNANGEITATYTSLDTSGTWSGNATKLGTTTVGGTGTPIYLNSGAPKAITSAISVSLGGTGTTSLTSGAALIGNGTGAIGTRSITNQTSGTVTASTNLVTANSLVAHTNSVVGNYVAKSGDTMTGTLTTPELVAKKIKADDVVTQLLTAEGIQTKNWTASNISTIDGSFYICPTISCISGTIKYTSNGGTLEMNAGSGYSFDVNSIFTKNNNSAAWTSSSWVMITGEISISNEWVPIGTVRGKITATTPTTSKITIGNLTTNLTTDSSPKIIELMTSGTTYTFRNLKISLYSYYNNSQENLLGIMLTTAGAGNRTYIDIYDGSNKTNGKTSSSGFSYTEPMVRIGNLNGLNSYTQANGAFTVTPKGWGIYTTNGFFVGDVYAENGYIGGYTIGTDNLTKGTTRDASGSFWITPAQSSNSSMSQLATAQWAITTGQNFGVTTAGVLYATGANVLTATIGNASNKITIGTGTSGHSSIRYGMTTLADTTNNGFYIGTDGIALGKGVFKVTAAGALTATSADITGIIKATSGIIGNNATNKITIGNNTTNASIYSKSHSTLASTGDGFYIGSDGISIGSKFKYTGGTTNTLTVDTITATNFTFNTGSISGSVTIGGTTTSASTVVSNAANGQSAYNDLPNKASNSAEYEVIIKVNSVNYTAPSATLIAIPTKLGASTTGTFVWYKNAIGTAHGGTVSTTTNTNDTLTITDLNALYIAVLQ